MDEKSCSRGSDFISDSKSTRALHNAKRCNAPLHKEWDVLLLQELYIDSFGNTKATSRWHVIYPSSHLTDGPICRSVILVNALLDTNAWAQVPLEGSNDITVLQFWLPQGRVTFFFFCIILLTAGPSL